MSSLKIKVPVLITAPIDALERTYAAMRMAVVQRINDYNNLPLDNKAIVQYRKKLKNKTIKYIETSECSLADGTPVLLLRIEEYKTGHEDVYLHTNVVNETELNRTDQLGSRMNYVLLYPLLEFFDDGSVQNRWCAFVYSDPSKDDADIKNTAKSVLTRVLQYKVKTVLATSVQDRINQAESVKQLKISYVTVNNQDNNHVSLRQYEIRYKHQDSKEIVYEGVPSEETLACLNDRDLDGYQKKVISVKVSDSLSYKYVYESQESDNATLATIEENNCYEIDVNESELNHIHDTDVVLRHLTRIVSQFMSNE